MTASPDLHPEDLIERGEQGRLTAPERARLDEHVRHCLACRVERMARVDFEHEAEALPGRAEVGRILAGLLAPTVERRRARSVLSSGLGRTLLAVALALVTGLGITAVRRPLVSGPARTAASAILAGPLPGRGIRFAEPTPPASAAAPAVDPDASEDSLRPRKQDGSRSIPAASIHASVGDRPSASTLFEQAATARHAGDHPRAADLYRSLIQAFPESPEADAALILFGRMQLDDGDEADAVVLLDRYLQSIGAKGTKGTTRVLEQDALVGRALALERLGRAADASQAWLALLQSYPNSAHADRARIHLATLAQR